MDKVKSDRKKITLTERKDHAFIDRAYIGTLHKSQELLPTV